MDGKIEIKKNVRQKVEYISRKVDADFRRQYHISQNLESETKISQTQIFGMVRLITIRSHNVRDANDRSVFDGATHLFQALFRRIRLKFTQLQFVDYMRRQRTLQYGYISCDAQHQHHRQIIVDCQQ